MCLDLVIAVVLVSDFHCLFSWQCVDPNTKMAKKNAIYYITDLGKCTHQCHETQGNNSTEVLSTKIVFFGCKNIDNKRRGKKRRGQTRRS